MDIWAVLEISPTSDMDIIKKAYKAKLISTHPEEKPEEFKELRAAYETALKLALQADENGDSSASGAWRAKLSSIYNNFSRRRNPEEWKKLFEEDFSKSLASRPQALDVLLNFVMENYYISHACWQEINNFFDILGKKEELSQKYPEDFLKSAVYSGIMETNYLQYELFGDYDACQPDEYIKQYFKAQGQYQQGKLEDAKKEIDILEGLEAKHPFTELMKAQVLLTEGEHSRAYDKAKALYEMLPDNETVLAVIGDCARLSGDSDTAKDYYSKALEISPKQFRSLFGRALSNENLQDWKSATDDFAEILEIFPLNDDAFQGKKRCYEGWAKELKAIKETLTNRQSLDLVWAMMELGEFKEAVEIVLSIETDNNDDEYEKQNSAGNLYLALGEFEPAYDHALKWEETIHNIPKDSEEAKHQRRLTKLPRCYSMQAMALYGLGRKDEAFEKMDEAIELSEEDSNFWRIKCNWYFEENKFKESADCAKRLSQLTENDPLGYYLYGLSQFNLLNYAEAYWGFESAIARNPYTMLFYVYKFKILMIKKAKDEAMELLEFLRERSAPEEDLAFLENYFILSFGTDEQKKTAEQEILEIARDPKVGEGCRDILFYIASLNEELSYQQQLDFVSEGLKYRSFDIDLTSRYTWLSNQLGNYEDAIKMAEESLTLYPFAVNQKYRLAFANIKLGRYEEAARAYLETAEAENIAEDFYFAGLTSYYANQPENARKHFEKALEMDNKLFRANRYLALIERDCGKKEESVKQLKEAISKISEDDKNEKSAQYRLLFQILSHFGSTEESFKAALDCARLDNRLGAYCGADEIYENARLWDKAFTARNEYFEKNKDKKQEKLIEEGYLYLRQGEIKKAYKICKSLKIAQKTSEYHKFCAICYLAVEKPKKAYASWKLMTREKYGFWEDPVFFWMLHDLKLDKELKEVLANKQEYFERWLDVDGQGRNKNSVLCNISVFKGEYEKFDELLVESEKLALCPYCKFDVCKDILESLAHRCEMQGDLSGALEYWEDMNRKYAGDEITLLHIIRIKKKMQEKKAL
ncbi:tetratricopeptide repeat protein [Clostridiaceae bacterium OttesenSCG-928-D20]|nr:tetratricopeptide repeat protein [Clostridiaceae bacterium OttesenSCG-928-D20]